MILEVEISWIEVVMHWIVEVQDKEIVRVLERFDVICEFCRKTSIMLCIDDAWLLRSSVKRDEMSETCALYADEIMTESINDIEIDSSDETLDAYIL
jgi:hypothetical protein